jgi:hypothetical protein
MEPTTTHMTKMITEPHRPAVPLSLARHRAEKIGRIFDKAWSRRLRIRSISADRLCSRMAFLNKIAVEDLVRAENENIR